MTDYNTFNHKNSKLNELYSNVQRYKAQVPELTKPKPVEHPITYLKKNRKVEIPTTPVYYDLYNWLGTTYASGGGDSPEPASAYDFDGGYVFKYPVFDFRVPKGSTPMDIVIGSTEEQWEYSSSIAIINSSVFLRDVDETLLNFIKVKSYLYNDNDEPASCDDFSEIYRWHKDINGYTFYYNAFFSVDQDEPQLLIKAELILMSPHDYDAQSSIKLK